MPGPDLSCIHPIIVKVLISQQAVFISYQPITCHIFRIELYLDLYILGNCDQCAAHLIYQYFFCLIETVKIIIIAVSIICQRLHFIVLDVAGAHSKNRQMNAAFFLLLYQPDKPALTADSHVQISVRCKNHPIISSRNKILFRQLIGFLNPRLPSRGAACLQILKGSHNFCLIFSGHTVQNYRFITRISDNRHPIPFIQIFCQHSESLLHQRQLIIGIHGTRHIQQKHKIRKRTVIKINFLCLQSNHQKAIFFIPRAV